MEHPFDDIQEYGLGSLEPAAAEALLDHADRCPTCAVLVAESMRGVAALESDAPARTSDTPLRSTTVPPGTSARFRTRRSATWPAIAGLATAASLALFAWNIQLRSAMPALAPPPVEALVHSHFVHHPLAGAPGAGYAKAIVAADGSWVFVVADQLVPENQFDVWETRDGQQVRLGSFTADSAGEGTAYFNLPTAKPEGFEIAPAGADPATSASALRWP